VFGVPPNTSSPGSAVEDSPHRKEPEAHKAAPGRVRLPWRAIAAAATAGVEPHLDLTSRQKNLCLEARFKACRSQDFGPNERIRTLPPRDLPIPSPHEVGRGLGRGVHSVNSSSVRMRPPKLWLPPFSFLLMWHSAGRNISHEGMGQRIFRISQKTERQKIGFPSKVPVA